MTRFPVRSSASSCFALEGALDGSTEGCSEEGGDTEGFGAVEDAIV
jgi:hypothetical protein